MKSCATASGFSTVSKFFFFFFFLEFRKGNVLSILDLDQKHWRGLIRSQFMLLKLSLSHLLSRLRFVNQVIISLFDVTVMLNSSQTHPNLSIFIVEHLSPPSRCSPSPTQVSPSSLSLHRALSVARVWGWSHIRVGGNVSSI